jgi:hypothetical protein
MHFLLTELKLKAGLHSIQVARARDDYFDVDLETRRKFFGAPSTFALCKTIVMVNSKHAAGVESFPEVAEDPFYPKYVIVITQFEAKLNCQKLLQAMKKYQNENT